MRIIERTNLVNKSILFVVQEETYNGYAAQGPIQGGGLFQVNPYQKKYTDLRHFATLEEAKTFVYNYQNSLGPGERIVG